MKNLIKTFRRAFRPIVSDTRIRDTRDVEREAARRTVMRVTTGDIRSQRGQYVPREDTDRLWERVKEHRFSDD